jgi:DNA-directed RNA polymerases I, II, and III subunit RPABC2
LETLKIEYKNITFIIYKMASDDEEEVIDELADVDEDDVDDEEEEGSVAESAEELSEYGDESVQDDETAEEGLEEDEPLNPYQVKFNDEMRQKYLQQYHPQEMHKPFEEIYKLTLITRNENGVIVDPLHKAYPILSKYERAKILGLRVSQLNKGAKPYVNINKNILDNILIAEKELKEKKIPFIIMRPMPNGKSEYWNVNDLEDL